MVSAFPRVLSTRHSAQCTEATNRWLWSDSLDTCPVYLVTLVFVFPASGSNVVSGHMATKWALPCGDGWS